jgi:hypothetical protein
VVLDQLAVKLLNRNARVQQRRAGAFFAEIILGEALATAPRTEPFNHYLKGSTLVLFADQRFVNYY